MAIIGLFKICQIIDIISNDVFYSTLEQQLWIIYFISPTQYRHHNKESRAYIFHGYIFILDQPMSWKIRTLLYFIRLHNTDSIPDAMYSKECR